MVSRLEEYFDEGELEDAEAFFVDYLRGAGRFRSSMKLSTLRD